MRLERTRVVLRPDPSRVVFRAFHPTSEARATRIVARVLAMSEREVEATLQEVMEEFRDRHAALARFFLRRFEQVRPFLVTDAPLSEARRLLIGAYFTQEYSLESAALFNPSIVPHPDPSGVAPGATRFVLSLRATGEGHVSSLTFRSGVIGADGDITLDPPSRFVTAPEPTVAALDRGWLEQRLIESGLWGPTASAILEGLSARFTAAELEVGVAHALRGGLASHPDALAVADEMIRIARANYDVEFSPEQPLSERVLFPASPTESHGIEDARFVRFEDEEGARYLGTYTAYDGRDARPQLVETEDFLRFRVRTLHGTEVVNKGMALFPRKIDGQYVMLSRQDNEHIYLMRSEHLLFWRTKTLLLRPAFPWEYVQLGNCGPPIETEAGWLALTHGVGPMRKYSMGAILLDRDDPSRVIGRLPEPLLTADENEREGYVPNVVYSCGALLCGETLVIPYAMSDSASTFARVPLSDVLEAMVSP